MCDHLGSPRVILNESMDILEQNDYYPFGMRHDNAAMMVSNNRFRYNGKEIQQIGGWICWIMGRGCMMRSWGGGLLLTHWLKKGLNGVDMHTHLIIPFVLLILQEWKEINRIFPEVIFWMKLR